MRTQPVVIELDGTTDPLSVLRAFGDSENLLLLESARKTAELGRYSYFMADPVLSFRMDSPSIEASPFDRLRGLASQMETERNADLPPFQGGFAGLLGYELGTCFESLPTAERDPVTTPILSAGLFDTVIAWDHDQDCCWLIARDLSLDSAPERATAEARAQDWQQRLSASEFPIEAPLPIQSQQPIGADFPLPGHDGVFSNFSRDSYCDAVRKVVEHIEAGDIFQANLSQRLVATWTGSAIEMYAAVREKNPAPFSGFMRTPEFAIVSGSPERFLSVHDREVETRPIKGTRGRSIRPEVDLRIRDVLRASEKDIAENVMIVDLLRNDLSRVCTSESVHVPTLCRVETYETVQHLVSVVTGKLQANEDAFTLLERTFPGGSITGAPKIRAMEIITEQERFARGPYCGSLFWHSLSGDMDSSILIRTMLLKGGQCVMPVGGGIVADSDPQSEYLETLDKAAGSLRALELARERHR